MSRKLLIAGALLGLIAIILGAFAAHGLNPLLTVDKINTFETGVKYQMYSALFLLVLGGYNFISERVKMQCFSLTLTGVLLFSGSIYLLATNSLTPFDFEVIGWITPVGGILMITAWLVLFISFIKLKIK